MFICFLGINASGEDIIILNSLEETENILNKENVSLLVIGENFSSTQFTRDIVLYDEKELRNELKNISKNKEVKIVFLSEKE